MEVIEHVRDAGNLPRKKANKNVGFLSSFVFTAVTLLQFGSSSNMQSEKVLFLKAINVFKFPFI